MHICGTYTMYSGVNWNFDSNSYNYFTFKCAWIIREIDFSMPRWNVWISCLVTFYNVKRNIMIFSTFSQCLCNFLILHLYSMSFNTSEHVYLCICNMHEYMHIHVLCMYLYAWICIFAQLFLLVFAREQIFILFKFGKLETNMTQLKRF